MKRLLDWIKTHTGATILICALFFVVPLVTVHILFKIPAWSDCLVAEWSAGELLAYIAGFEALVGTVFLGLITVDQTEQASWILISCWLCAVSISVTISRSISSSGRERRSV